MADGPRLVPLARAVDEIGIPIGTRSEIGLTRPRRSRTGFAEAALAPIVGDKTARAYKRGDALEKRRELMEAWPRYCTGSGVVVPIRRTGAYP